MKGELDAIISQMHRGGILYTEAVWETPNPRTGHPPEANASAELVAKPLETALLGSL